MRACVWPLQSNIADGWRRLSSSVCGLGGRQTNGTYERVISSTTTSSLRYTTTTTISLRCHSPISLSPTEIWSPPAWVRPQSGSFRPVDDHLVFFSASYLRWSGRASSRTETDPARLSSFGTYRVFGGASQMKRQVRLAVNPLSS